MPISAADLSALNSLMDVALTLRPDDRRKWFDGLRDEPLKAMLADMLAQDSSLETSGFMTSLPRLDAVLAADDHGPRAGDVIGAYELVRELGSGGMGTVWLADRIDGGLRRPVALKLPRLAWGPGLVARMGRERDIGARLEHPNIARLYDAGVDRLGRPFLALEYVEGEPIDAWCKAQRCDVAQRLRLVLQVARAVAYAHARLVVHRDVKPSNVLVTATGEVRLLDFGIAMLMDDDADGRTRMTEIGGGALTPPYASPEQMRGDRITVASDVYSLGVLLFELLAERLPFPNSGLPVAQLELARRERLAPRASLCARDAVAARLLRGEIDAILDKALQYDVDRRYATADAFADDVQRHLAGDAVQARGNGVGYRLMKAVRRHRIGVGATAVVMATVLGGSVAALAQSQRANEEAANANAAAARASAVKEFVVDIFRINSPENPGTQGLRQLPVETLLEHGGAQIDEKFKDQPDLKAELHGVVARIMLDMGSTELGLQYARRQAKSLPPEASATRQAEAALLLAEALLQDAHANEAENALALALSCDCELATQVRVRLLMSRIRQRQDLYDGAMGQLGAAEQLLQQSPTLPRRLAAEALYQRARLLAWNNRFDLARPIFDKAIAAATESDGAGSRLAARIRLDLAEDLVRAGYAQEAKRAYAIAFAAMRATGAPNDVETAEAEATSAELLAAHDAMSYREAEAVLARTLKTFDDLGSRVPPRLRAQVESAYASLAMRFGRVELGYRLAEHSASVMRSIAPQEDCDCMLSFGAMLVGRHDEAEQLMRRYVDEHQHAGGAQPPHAVHLFVTWANNRMMAGDLAGARKALDEVPMFEDMNGAANDEMDMWRQAVRVARARVDMEQGRYASTLRQLEGLPDRWYMMNSVALMRGVSLCNTGQVEAGLSHLRPYLAERERKSADYAFSPWLAYDQAQVGLCELRAGHRAVAAGLAAKANAAFAEQPGVSPFFKQPSGLLTRALRRSGASQASAA